MAPARFLPPAVLVGLVAAAGPARSAAPGGTAPWQETLGQDRGASQPPQAPPPTVAGYLRAGADPVADAAVQFVPDPAPAVPVLVPRLLPPTPHAATSNARGGFRIAVPDARPGTLLITHASGLGAVVDRWYPGRAQRVELRPMAEVTIGGGSDEFTLWPARRLPSGELRHLPRMRGRSARLPAGTYEVWFELAEGYGWQRLDLRAGGRTTLRWSAGSRRLAHTAGAVVSPAGFPQVVLLDDSRPAVTLLGDAVGTDLQVDWVDRAQLAVDRPLPPLADDAPAAAVPWPPAGFAAPATFEVEVSGVAPGTAPRAFLLERSPTGQDRVVGAAHAMAPDRLLVPLPATSGDHHVIVIADQRAPVAIDLPSLRRVPRIRLATGRVIDVRVWDTDRQPATGVVVHFLSADGPAVAAAEVDEAGVAVVGPVADAGVLVVADPDHLLLEHEVGAAETRAELVLDRGLDLRGQVAEPDGSPAVAVAVTLRDATGRLRPNARTVLTDDAGRFVFAGLPAGLEVVLLAQRTRPGQTWSARIRAMAGSADARLELRHEDPQLRPGGR